MFEEIKEKLTTTSSFVFLIFRVLKIACATSSVGIFCVLSQEGHLISYLAKN